MKTEIKSKVERVVENYKRVADAFMQDIKKWEKDSLYSSDYKQGMIRKIKADMILMDADFNNRLVIIMNQAKVEIENQDINKPGDYQVQISNALEFIRQSGEKLTDDQAFEIVMPFLGDHKTMKLFKIVFTNRSGKDQCNVTQHLLNGYERIINKLDTLEGAFKTFFNAGKYSVGSLEYTLRESMIIVEAEEIDSMLEKLNDRIQLNFKEIELEMETIAKEEMGVNA